MHKTDIQRTRRQVEKVADSAEEIVEITETISDAGYDVADNQKILEKQKKLVEELAQALSDFNELTKRAETVEISDIIYNPSANDLELVHDKENSEVDITYNGSKEIPVSDISITKSGKSISPFSNSLTNGDSATIDVSQMADGEQIVVSLPQTRKRPNQKLLNSWNKIIGTTESPSVSMGDYPLPEHNLVEESSTLTKSITIGNII
jgi:archaellum component FlaF (FlaF/FlaG flagellin family)